jgi:hypothetical protein
MSSLIYAKEEISSIKYKSEDIRLLGRRIDDGIDKYESDGQIFQEMRLLLSGLDIACRYKYEMRNLDKLQKVTVLSLYILKELGYNEIEVRKGDVFDCELHKVIGVKSCNLPSGTILDVVFRGFRNGKVVVPAEVIVVENIVSVDDESCKVGLSLDCKGLSEDYMVCLSVDCKGGLQKKKKLNIRSDEEYRKSVNDFFEMRKDDIFMLNWLKENYEKLLCVYSFNFDPVRERIESLYSKDRRGNPPCNPIAIIRALLLMIVFGETRIGEWISRIRSEPVLAIISGFEIGKTPCVGSYYNFFKRLENGPYQPRCEHVSLKSDIRQNRNPYKVKRKKPEGGGKERKNHPPKINVLRTLKNKLDDEKDIGIPEDIEKILNEILLETSIKPSIEKGFISNVSNLSVSGDGSDVETYSSPNGKMTCGCRKKKVFNCNHLRKISDLDAKWGWDNRVKDFVYGYKFYQFVASDNKHDLPFYISFAPANKHDAVMSIEALERIRKQNLALLPEAKIGYVALDAAHDAYALYHYLIEHDIKYAIAYSKEPSEISVINGNNVDKDGTPICPAGNCMRRHYKNKFGHIVYNCPIKRPTHENNEHARKIHYSECSKSELCEPDSAWGPYVVVKSKDDPRIHTEIRRGSKEYFKLYNSRTSCERSNAAKKEHCKLKYVKSRVMVYLYIKTVLISMIEHSRAWVKERLKGKTVTTRNVLELFK